jgi:hypothetical protein
VKTFKVTYKQFPRARRNQYTVKIQANNIIEARKKYQDTIRLAQLLQHHTPFICNHIQLISIFPVREA